MSAAYLGILMLDTRFPRPLGDAGNPASWPMPVRPAVVPGASPQRVVRDADPALLPPFIAAARQLVHDGAAAITTSCGFLVLWQHALQAALPVPVWTSSLLKLRELNRPGILTVDAQALGKAHLLAADADAATPIEGLKRGCPLQQTLLHNLPALDAVRAQADVVAAAIQLVQRHPQIDSIVFECTNLPPYADAVQRATTLPVHHLLSFVQERWKDLP